MQLIMNYDDDDDNTADDENDNEEVEWQNKKHGQ